MRKYIVVFTVFILFYTAIYLVQTAMASKPKPKPHTENIYQTYGLRAVDSVQHSKERNASAAPQEIHRSGQRVSAQRIRDMMVRIEPEEIEGEAPKKIAGVPIGFAVRVKADLLRNLKAGDSVEIPSKEEHYRFYVSRAYTTHRNSKVVEGELVLDGVHYSIVLSGKGKFLFASYSTPEGSYDAEAIGRYGYVYAQDDFSAHRIDTKVEDTVTRAP